MPNKFAVEYVTRAGAWPFLHASWSCFDELCGRAFFTAYVTSLCLQSVSGSAVWIQTWRAPCPHSDTTRFWLSFQWISAPAFLCLQSAKFYGFTEFSLKSGIRWRFATLLYTNCPGRPPETGNTLAITYHVHVPHAHWTSLGLTATATAVAWTVTEVRAWTFLWTFFSVWPGWCCNLTFQDFESKANGGGVLKTTSLGHVKLCVVNGNCRLVLSTSPFRFDKPAIQHRFPAFRLSRCAWRSNIDCELYRGTFRLYTYLPLPLAWKVKDE